jgi:GTP cyclohydrolase I
VDKPAIESAIRQILRAMGEDPQREGLLETPRRMADMYEELFSGLTADPRTLLTTGFEAENHKEMVVVKDIPFYSMCVPSKQLVDAVGGQKRAADVNVGDWLYTIDGGEIKTTEVVALSSRKSHELICIDADPSAPIYVTPDHPIMTSEGWRPADKLRIGDQIEWVRPHQQYPQRRYPITEGYDLGYALGAVAADASIQDARRISLCVRSRSFAERFATAFGEAFGRTPRVEAIEVPSGFLARAIPMFRVRIVSSYIAGLMLKWFGCKGQTKDTKGFKLPRGILRTREMTQGCLDGYIDGDGHVLPKTGSMIVSSNVPFLEELGAVVGSRPAAKLRSGDVTTLYISNRWHQPGWYGRSGFVPAIEPYDMRDSKFIRVTAVSKRPCLGRKPFTVYTFTCAPHPTFCITGILTHNCEHHLMPFHGHAHVGYIPQGRIVGISKIARLVEALARRPQVQERLTSQIADLLCAEGLRARGAAVVIEAEHLCMTARGVKKPGSKVVTSASRGIFREDARTRAEFFSIISGRS